MIASYGWIGVNIDVFDPGIIVCGIADKGVMGIA